MRRWMQGRHRPRVGTAWRLAAVATLVVVAAGPAVASIAVSPLVLEQAVEAGDRIGPVVIQNTGKSSIPVRVELAWVSHDAAGFPQFRRDAAGTTQAAAVLRPDWWESDIPPGASTELYFRVQGPERDEPIGSGGWTVAYPGVLIATPAATGTLRVGVAVILTRSSATPGPADGPAWRMTGLYADQAAPQRPVELVAVIRNDGTTHGRASGTMEVRDGRGTRLAVLPVGPALVLPGASRLLRAVWAPAELPPGAYSVTWRPAEPGASPRGVGGSSTGLALAGPASVTTAFEVSAPYRLALARGDLDVALVADPVRPPRLRATVWNQGSTPVVPRMLLELWRDGVAVAQQSSEGPLVAAGAQAAAELGWPAGLSAGRYTAQVTWLDTGGRPVARRAVEVNLSAALVSRLSGGDGAAGDREGVPR